MAWPVKLFAILVAVGCGAPAARASSTTPVPWPVSVDCPIPWQRVPGVWQLQTILSGVPAEAQWSTPGSGGYMILRVEGRDLEVDHFYVVGMVDQRGRAPVAAGPSWSVHLQPMGGAGEASADRIARFAGHCRDDEFAMTITVGAETYWMTRLVPDAIDPR
jgi:hypothetical protein